jgi:hypothetical protein
MAGFDSRAQPGAKAKMVNRRLTLIEKEILKLTL